MAIKQSYEISIWSEILGENGQKIEHKDFIIGANDMEYLGRAVDIRFEKKLDGTHTLTFSLPSRYYDSKIGEYVQNEFIDQLYNERKVKFYFKDKWYEFYIKSISEAKSYKTFIKTYTCSDAFIDELSRNGYEITFDEELYNNVEEIGDFTNQILENSIWKYSPENNWGDFTEYSEEKLYKIPVSQFKELKGYKLNFSIENTEEKVLNLFTNESRKIEMGDDLASKRFFWDQLNGDNLLLGKEPIEIENDGFIYVPISQLDFCYVTTSLEDEAVLTATEEIVAIPNHSYALAPTTVDPNGLIQFIAIPKNSVVEIDEAGLIVNKDYSYVMTIEQWNKALKHNKWFYEFEPFNQFDNDKGIKRITKSFKEEGLTATGNYCAYYNGYLDSISDKEVLYGKKISISDRTEINSTKDIDQFVKVYNKTTNDIIKDEIKYEDILEENNDWNNSYAGGYRICSKTSTRQIVPQLARNLIQNGVNIKSIDGWEVQDLNVNTNQTPTTITFVKSDNGGRLNLTKSNSDNPKNNTIINFGACAQETILSNEKIYCFGYKGYLSPDSVLIIGEGKVEGTGTYNIDPVYRKSIGEITNKQQTFRFLKLDKEIKNPYIAIELNNKEKWNDDLENTFDGINKNQYYIEEIYFFEAYTKGVDQFNSEDAKFKYSGRQLFEDSIDMNIPYDKETCQKMILFEDSIMPGDTYEYNEYFIQQVQARNENELLVNDTFLTKDFISPEGNLNGNTLPYSSQKFTNEDLTFVTRKFNMNKCPYYKEGQLEKDYDCCYGCSGGECEKLCMYQKYGYCPYLFQTEKHCRKVRTLKQEKSNRFNLTQELSKVFEIYPMYWTKFNSQGKILFDNNNSMDKRIFYITEKGKENKLGFRYEKNLSNISRNLKSDSIVTKLYVEDIDSEFSKTGLCSIKTAADNISKDNFILDFSYYISKGILNKEEIERDLYGKEDGDLAYLKQLGYYNTEYDKISNLIINLSSESFIELESNIEVNLEAITTAQQQLLKLKKQLSKYGFNDVNNRGDNNSNSIENLFSKYDEQYAILKELFNETFCTNGISEDGYTVNNISIEDFKQSDSYKYHTYSSGMLGQYNKEYNQIQECRRRQGTLLSKINELSLKFYRKYEPYLKEGTWTDSNYLTDNAYYFGAKEVAAEGSIPKVSYTISTIDLSALPNFKEDYEFDIADTTYIEDVGMFGINSKTGMPNKLKVLISSITYNPDQPMSNTITVQNFTTQFEDLFKQVSASVQSLTFNENIYKRSSNFTSNQNIKEDSLQGTLNNNNLTLINTQENNIELNSQGQSGSDINNHNNKYKLNGQGLYFSNNGGQSWNVGVGPSGINADYIKVGNLDAGKIKIVDNDYLYFYWDKDGIIALKEPTKSNEISFNNFAVFNRTGLSLVKENKVRLRAGYDLKSDNGYFKSNEDTSGDIGFYLYDTNGHKIFSTRNDNDLSARIDLRGELCANGAGTLDIIKKTYYNCFTLSSINCERYFVSNLPLETIILDNGKNLKEVMISIFNNPISNQINYTESITNTLITITEETNNILINNNNYYKTNVSILNINGTIYDGKYSYFGESGDIIYKMVDTVEINLANNIEGKTYISQSQDFELQEKEIIFYSGGEQTAGKGIYPYEINNGETYYYRNNEVSSSEVINTYNNTIGVYVNNMDINSQQDAGGTLKRIFSCVKFNKNNNGTVQNLFSILTDGSVYMGGTLKTINKNEQTIDNFDYNVENITGNNILKLDANGRIYFGGSDIVQSLQDQINEIAARGIVPHHHWFEASMNNGFWLENYPNPYYCQIKNNQIELDLADIFKYLRISNETGDAY